MSVIEFCQMYKAAVSKERRGFRLEPKRTGETGESKVKGNPFLISELGFVFQQWPCAHLLGDERLGGRGNMQKGCRQH